MMVDAKELADLTRRLRRYFPRGRRVYTVLTAGSGARDYIRVMIVFKGQIHEVTRFLSKVFGYKCDVSDRGIIINGGGFDKGFEIVQRISQTLYNETYALNHERL